MEGGEIVREAFRKFRAGESLSDREKRIVDRCLEGGFEGSEVGREAFRKFRADETLSEQEKSIVDRCLEGSEVGREGTLKYRADETLSEQEKSIVDRCLEGSEVGREGTLKYRLKKWMTDSSDEDISNLITSGFWDALWDQRFRYNELIEFQKQHGHCNVPCHANPQLGHWVTNQRQAFKKYIADETLPLDDEVTVKQVSKLQDIGFDWGYNCTDWDQRYNELINFEKQHGHCKVPQQYDANPQLGNWVSTQRHAFKKYIADETLPLDDKVTVKRVSKLQDIGFIWDAKSYRLEPNNVGKSVTMSPKVEPIRTVWLMHLGKAPSMMHKQLIAKKAGISVEQVEYWLQNQKLK